MGLSVWLLRLCGEDQVYDVETSQVSVNKLITFCHWLQIRYAHFQRKDCFVSRDHNLRSSALKYEAEKREAEAKTKRDKEARLAVDREKRRAREVKKQERIAKMQQMAEQQIKAKNDERAASSSSAHSSGRAKKMPERFDDGVSDEMLDFITSDAMAGIYDDGTAKATKKRKAEELEIEYTFEEPVPQVWIRVYN